MTSTSRNPYGSARDLPSYIETAQLVKGLQLLGPLIPKETRRDLRSSRAEMEALFDSVDKFYELLGPRNWIYNDGLSASAVAEMLADDPAPEVAEERLIEIQFERLESSFWMLGLQVDGLKQRRPNLERARQHYFDGQFDSCALMLVTVMDGFVNDFQTDPRRGLHARTEENEMFAWNSIVGHHLGLTSVMKTFLKPCYKRQDEEVFELYRHGIVHGSVVNYNNPVVAMKAWNMLYAVVDWAKATTEAAKPKEPKPTLKGTAQMLKERGDRKRLQEQFEPTELTVDDPAFDQVDVVVRATKLLEAWQKGQWGLMPDLVTPGVVGKNKSNGEAAKWFKNWLEFLPLHDFELTDVSFPQLAVAEIRGTASIGDKSGPLKMRWCQFGDDGKVSLMGAEDSVWRVAIWNPYKFVEAADAD